MECGEKREDEIHDTATTMQYDDRDEMKERREPLTTFERSLRPNLSNKGQCGVYGNDVRNPLLSR